jgi:hypothetical protein
MRASENTVGRKNDPTTVSSERRRITGACLALAVLTIAAATSRPSFAGVSSTPPVSKCSDFACEQ